MITYLTVQVRHGDDGSFTAAAQVHTKEARDAEMVLVKERAFGSLVNPCCWLHTMAGAGELAVLELKEHLS